jgi:hypothetical protein
MPVYQITGGQQTASAATAHLVATTDRDPMKIRARFMQGIRQS